MPFPYYDISIEGVKPPTTYKPMTNANQQPMIVEALDFAIIPTSHLNLPVSLSAYEDDDDLVKFLLAAACRVLDSKGIAYTTTETNDEWMFAIDGHWFCSCLSTEEMIEDSKWELQYAD